MHRGITEKRTLWAERAISGKKARCGVPRHSTPLHLLTPVCEDNSSSALGGPRLGATESRPALAVSASRAIVHAARALLLPHLDAAMENSLRARFETCALLFLLCAHLPRQCAEWKADADNLCLHANPFATFHFDFCK